MFDAAKNLLSGLSTRLGKAYHNLRDDAVQIDLVPVLGSSGTFLLSRGEDGTGDVVIAGNIILTYPEPIRFDRFTVTLIGETVITDLLEKYEDRTVHLREEYVLSEFKTLYPSSEGSIDPHVEDFSFTIPAHRALSPDTMPPSARIRSKKFSIDVQYRIVVEVVKVIPGDLTFKKEAKVIWAPLIDWDGIGIMGDTVEQHMEISHQLSIPKAFIAGTPMPIAYKFTSENKDDSDPSLIDISGNVYLGDSNGPRRSVFVPRVKESHIYLVERISLIPSDANYQTSWSTPIIRRYAISSLIGDAVLSAGWSIPESREIRMPRWSATYEEDEDAILVDNGNVSIATVVTTASAVAGTATLMRRKETAESTFVNTQPTVTIDDPDAVITNRSGINPTGVFCGGKIKIEHSIESILVFHDSKTKKHEIPIRVEVEDPRFWNSPPPEIYGYDPTNMIQVEGNAGLTEEEALALVLEQSKIESEKASVSAVIANPAPEENIKGEEPTKPLENPFTELI
ncbi:hypothetical protein HK096_003396 [Nowakowskiella sp. JEL0078]|nr:hypothetical protein HK096_003396 [Nowakowskiella sp. JEL0078]